ncbi:MAG: ApaG domain, partial [Proteobacteria bacterium]|nr:ApaG domain [Pseudomonadota bacterium]
MTDPRAYAETTEAITITVEPFYLDEQSEPDDGQYVWAYHVRSENNGQRTVR